MNGRNDARKRSWDNNPVAKSKTAASCASSGSTHVVVCLASRKAFRRYSTSRSGEIGQVPTSVWKIRYRSAAVGSGSASRSVVDANQSARLKALADLLHAQHAAGGDLHRRVQALFAGNTFDRAGAQQLVSEKVAQVQASGPAVINAVGDFYDSLNATQQQQVRDFMARAHHHGMWMHHHGASAPAGN